MARSGQVLARFIAGSGGSQVIALLEERGCNFSPDWDQECEAELGFGSPGRQGQSSSACEKQTPRFWLQLDDFNNTEFDIRTPEQWLESLPQHCDSNLLSLRGLTRCWSQAVSAARWQLPAFAGACSVKGGFLLRFSCFFWSICGAEVLPLALPPLEAKAMRIYETKGSVWEDCPFCCAKCQDVGPP